MLTDTVADRMANERFQAETVFEDRYLKPLGQRYEFFGEKPDAWKAYKASSSWPAKLEREKPDFWLPDAKVFYECVGCYGDTLRMRQTKTEHMLYWCYMLSAKGFFAIYNSKTDEGMLVEADAMLRTVKHRSTKELQLDNPMYEIKLSTLIGGK